MSASKWWFACRLDSERTEVFDTFSKSSAWGQVIAAIGVRFKIKVEEHIFMHKGKILADKTKVLHDCGIDRGETVIFYKRFIPPMEAAMLTASGEAVIPVIHQQQPQPPLPEATNKEGYELPCPECGWEIESRENEDVVCEDCHGCWHWACLDPPLTSLPTEEWFCVSCTNDADAVVRPDNEAQFTKAKERKNGSWGGGMSNEGHSRVCSLPSDHRGPIPGIDVGQSWKFRKECGEDGVHRPPVAGIAGTANAGDGAVSIVMSGGYSSDVDHGDWFLYTGSGGFSTAESGSRTSQRQIRDQELHQYNLAIAKTCDAPLNENGAIARNWRNSKGIRVIRGWKAASKYAPIAGYRYDGIYKVVRYSRSAPIYNGFRRYIFEFRRDDSSPMPWTPEGEDLIGQLGLKMILPQEADAATNDKGKKSYEATCTSQWTIPQPIRIAIAEAISAIPAHEKTFARLLERKFAGKYEFVKFLQEDITCPVCKEFVNYPVTNPCGHTACLKCITLCAKGEYGCRCPLCYASLLPSTMNTGYGDSAWAAELSKTTFINLVEVDKSLIKVLRLCLGTYCEDAELDIPVAISPRNHNTDPNHTAKKVRKLVNKPDLVKSSKVVKISTKFSSERISRREHSRTTANHISTFSPPESQYEIDEQIFGGMGPIETGASVGDSEKLGFREKQALHFDQHHVSANQHQGSDLGFKELKALHQAHRSSPAKLVLQDGNKKPKRVFGEIGGDSRGNQISPEEETNEVDRRSRKKSARGSDLEAYRAKRARAKQELALIEQERREKYISERREEMRKRAHAS